MLKGKRSSPFVDTVPARLNFNNIQRFNDQDHGIGLHTGQTRAESFPPLLATYYSRYVDNSIVEENDSERQIARTSQFTDSVNEAATS